MIDIRLRRDTAALSRALGTDAPRKLKREIATAINATARATKNALAKENAKELATPQKVIKETIAVASKATPQKLGAAVRQRATSRISLKQFGARQTRTGVTYKISKTKGRKTVAGAFMGPVPGAIARKLNGHAFVRKGKERLPIVKLFGPSPWGVTTVNRLDKLIAKRDVRPELSKQIRRRIKAINFKKSQGA